MNEKYVISRDREEVRTELLRRGCKMEQIDANSKLARRFHLPELRTFAFPKTREVFHLHDDPPLGCWGQYDTDAQFVEELHNLTVNRWDTVTRFEINDGKGVST